MLINKRLSTLAGCCEITMNLVILVIFCTGLNEDLFDFGDFMVADII